MYNGVGLRTPRGSATNGYVQRNLSFAKPRQQQQHNYQYDPKLMPAKAPRKPTADIMLHRSKRQIEVDCATLEESLRKDARGKHSDEEVAAKVGALRERRLRELAESLADGGSKSRSGLREQKEKEMDRLRSAFGIRDDAVEGDAFKFEDDRAKQERLAKRQAEAAASDEAGGRERPKRLRGR